MAKFTEGQGGAIRDRAGREVLRINVEEMTTAEAGRLVQVVIAALSAEFGSPPDPVRTGAQTAHQGGVGKVTDRLAYGPAGEVT